MYRTFSMMITKLVLGVLVFYNWLPPLTVWLHDCTYYCQRLCIVASFPGPVRNIGKGAWKHFCVFSFDHYLSKFWGANHIAEWNHAEHDPVTCDQGQKCRHAIWVARDGVVCVSYKRVAVVSRLREISWWLKSESVIFPYGLSRETSRSSVSTGLDPDQRRRSVGICV